MADFQYPISSRTDERRPNHRITYVYACNGCGKEVSGYAHKRVRGHVWCGKCYAERQRNALHNKAISEVTTMLSDESDMLLFASNNIQYQPTERKRFFEQYVTICGVIEFLNCRIKDTKCD